MSDRFFVDFFFNNVSSDSIKDLREKVYNLDSTGEKQQAIDDFWYEQFIKHQKSNPWENAQRKGAKTIISKWGQKIVDGGRIRGYTFNDNKLVDYTSVYSDLKESIKHDNFRSNISPAVKDLKDVTNLKYEWFDKNINDYIGDLKKKGLDVKVFVDRNNRIIRNGGFGKDVSRDKNKLLNELKIIAENEGFGTHKLKNVNKINVTPKVFERRWDKKIELSRKAGKAEQLEMIRNSMNNLSINYDDLEVPVSQKVIKRLYDKAGDELNKIRKIKGEKDEFLITDPLNVDRDKVLSFVKDYNVSDDVLKRLVDESIVETSFISPYLDRNTRNKEVYRKVIKKIPGVRTVGEEVVNRFMELEYGDKNRHPSLKDLEKIKSISNKKWDLNYSTDYKREQRGFRPKTRDEILNDLITFRKSDDALIKSSTVKLKKIAKKKGFSVVTPKYVRSVKKVVPVNIFSNYKKKLSSVVDELKVSDSVGKRVNVKDRQFNDVVKSVIKEVDHSFGFPDPVIPF